MEQMKDSPGLLELLPHPGFLVQENIIVRVNAPAAAMQISVGTPIGELLDACREDYEGFSGGCLYLTLSLSGVPMGACAIRTEAGDVFLLEDARENSVLESLELASRQLRLPLSNVMVSAQSLFAQLPESPEIRETAARLNRGLYQLLRLVGNMSDADSSLSRQETISVGGTFDEIFEKAGVLCQQAGFCLDYSGLKEDLFAMADQQQLERAVYNLLSNAMKFAPQGSTITARLTRRHRRLYLQIQDSGESPRPADLFHRYLRQSTLEDSRFGIGLGMVLIHSCAASHGGTVLIDTPETGGTRVTLTMTLRQNPDTALRSPSLRVEYTGGRDSALIELSQQLPWELYLP